MQTYVNLNETFMLEMIFDGDYLKPFMLETIFDGYYLNETFMLEFYY